MLSAEAKLQQYTSGNIHIDFLFIDILFVQQNGDIEEYRVYQKKVNNHKMAYKSNMQLNFRRIFCEYGYFKVF